MYWISDVSESNPPLDHPRDLANYVEDLPEWCKTPMGSETMSSEELLILLENSYPEKQILSPWFIDDITDDQIIK